MGEGAPLAARVTSASNLFRFVILGLAVVLWLSCFALLRALGTWAPFALAGVSLAAVTLWVDADARALLRPSWRAAIAGVATGLLMVALTHLAFDILSPRMPGMRAAAERLLALARLGDFSAAARAALIVVIAGCEEVIFRGALLCEPANAEGARTKRLDRGDALRIAWLSAVYAAAMVTLGSTLLLVCAFGCGLVWGALRVSTRSLLAPMLAHVIWDVGVLIAWPLVPGAG